MYANCLFNLKAQLLYFPINKMTQGTTLLCQKDNVHVEPLTTCHHFIITTGDKNLAQSLIS